MSKSPTAVRGVRAFTVSALFAGPLLCAALFFQLETRGQDPGVYLETDDGAYTLSGYVDEPGWPIEAAMKTPVVADAPIIVSDPMRAFVIVGPPDSPLVVNAPSARLWCFVVDNADEPLHAHAVQVPATIRQISPRTFSVSDKLTGGWTSVATGNPRAYRVTSDELTTAWRWRPASVAYQQYQRALARTTRPRATMRVMIGLEIQDAADGPRRMYSVQVGPPQ